MESLVITLLFIFFLLLEGLLLPALIGPGLFFVTSLFLLGLVVYGRSSISNFVRIFCLLSLMSYFSSTNLIILLLSFSSVAAMYFIANRFLDIRSGINETSSPASIIKGGVVIFIANLIYSLIFILLSSPANISGAFSGWLILIKSASIHIAVLALIVSVLLSYVSKKE